MHSDSRAIHFHLQCGLAGVDKVRCESKDWTHGPREARHIVGNPILALTLNARRGYKNPPIVRQAPDLVNDGLAAHDFRRVNAQFAQRVKRREKRCAV